VPATLGEATLTLVCRPGRNAAARSCTGFRVRETSLRLRTVPGVLRPLFRVAGIGPEPDSAEDAWKRIETFFASHLL